MKKENLEKYYVASVSHAKNSVAMLHLILQNPEKYPLNHVVFVNTGFEFEAVYDVRNQVVSMLGELEIPYTELDISEQFRYSMLERNIHTRSGVEKIGYGWCGGPCRWGTSLKLQALNKFYRTQLSNYSVVEYVGYAADEPKRLDTAVAQVGEKVFPLVDFNISNAECLRMCYRLGYEWKQNGIYLYEFLERLSCWNCKNKRLKELRAMYFFLPQYWSKLKELERQIGVGMKGSGKSLVELEKRFAKSGFPFQIFHVMPPLDLCQHRKGGFNDCT